MKKERELRPIKDKPSYYDEIEARLKEVFKREIYIPLLAVMDARHEEILIKNSYDDLIQAIRSGQIQYVNGHFEGRFNSTLSRELRGFGAVWDRKHGWFSVPRSKLSPDMLSAIGTSHSYFKQMADRVDKRLGELIPAEIADKVKIDKLLGTTIWKVNKEFEESVASVGLNIKLSPEQVRRVSAEYTRNMHLYIQDWTEQEIIKLRKQVQEQVSKGFRYESMVKSIQESYGVSQNKAKFLARQETSLLVTKFKQTRYQEVGIHRYRWQCVAGSAAHPVRKMHKKLDGTKQTWDTPPIVNEKGERKNPGQDYNCRCVAVPIVEF